MSLICLRDLILSKTQADDVEQSTNTSLKRDAVVLESSRWTDGIIPYILDGSLDADKKQRIRKAMADYRSKTCINFVPKQKNHKNWIRFKNGRGCSSHLGKLPPGKENVIKLADGCRRHGTILHEIMHALGFWHEHSRLDRDNFIDIYWKNINETMISQFKKYPHGKADNLGYGYDYESVMHYPRHAFGKKDNTNGLMITIMPKKKPWLKIGQREKFK